MAMVEVVLQNDLISILKVDRRAVHVIRAALMDAACEYHDSGYRKELANICDDIYEQLVHAQTKDAGCPWRNIMEDGGYV